MSRAVMLTSFFLCFSIPWVAPPLSHAANEALQAGYGQADITPPLGTGMPGYFRERKADGVLDPLLAKVLVLRHGETTLAIVALDLLGVKRPVIQAIQREIEQTTSIPAENVFLHATHTHTGAAVDEIKHRLPTQTAEAAQKALNALRLEEAALYGMSRDDSQAFIRRYLMSDGRIRTNPGRMNPDVVRPIGKIDSRVHTLAFEKAKIMLVSYGLHPDCVGGTKFSADYPYHLTQKIKKTLGKEWNVVFLNAVSGNVNHINVDEDSRQKGDQEAQENGYAIALAALRGYEQASPIDLTPIQIQRKTVQTPYRKVPNALLEWAKQEAQENPKEASQRQFNEYTPVKILELAEKQGQYEPADIYAVHLGEMGLAGLPGEVFVEVGRDIQTHALPHPTMVIGITGGYMGYIPHHRGYDEGGYESTYGSARYGRETPLLWADAAVEMLNEMKRSGPDSSAD